jgi:hypothetical protein
MSQDASLVFRKFLPASGNVKNIHGIVTAPCRGTNQYHMINLCKTTFPVISPTNNQYRGGDLFTPILRFVGGYKTLDFKLRGTRRIKVALVDSGIVAVDINKRAKNVSQGRLVRMGNNQTNGAENEEEEEDISLPVTVGCSFVYKDSNTLPWHYSEDAHGTQMAHLIRALDPRCDLIVARVGGRRNPITAKNLAAVSIYIQPDFSGIVS